MNIDLRVRFSLMVITVAFLALSVRLVYLETFKGDFLQDQGDARTIRMERINAHRGMILDALNKPLAVSTPVTSIWANPSELPTDSAQLLRIADELGIPHERFLERVTGARDRNFIYITRHLPPAVASRVLSLEVPGIYGEREYKRFYPSAEVGAHLVGFTNIDDTGQEGLELAFDDWLAGKPGKKKVLKNLHGEIVRDVLPVAEAVPGRALQLSVDLRLQYLAYRELKSAVAEYGAQSGSIVLLDAESGRLLAMANQPSFNPNNRRALDLDAVRNRAVTDVFEPGSTVKPFTVAVALNSGDYLPESVIDTNPGFFKVAGKVIHDPSNRGEMDLGAIIAHSSQVGISRLALTLNEHEVWDMFRAVGLGEPTGIGYPGERNGYLPTRRDWRDIERVTFAYGYGLTVTPLQLAGAYLTIASGGIRRDITVLEGPVREGQRVMPTEVAGALKDMLARVVTEGTGSLAAIDGYPVAGKTGTARKIGEDGYEDTRHLAFFSGMAPVESPRIVGVVLINEPDARNAGGGKIAAPVFSRVVEGALRMMNEPPERASSIAQATAHTGGST